MALKSYLDQLKELAIAKKVPLARAFALAGVADTTRQRAEKGRFDLRYSTAKKVADVLAGERVLPTRR